MAGDLGDLVARLKVDTTSLDAAVAKIHGLGSALNVGFAAAAAAIVGVGVVSVDMAAKFQKSTDLLASQSGISELAAKRIGDAFLGTAGQVTFSAQSMMDAFDPVSGRLEFLNGKALDAVQSLSFMRTAMDLSEASGSALASTTADLSSIMLAFQIPLKGAAQAGDELFNAARTLGVPLDSLTTSLQRARTAAGAAAPSLADLSAFLLDLAAHGESGRSAMALLGTALSGIELPTAKVIAAQKDLGVSFINNKGQLDSLSSIIAQVSPLIAGMGNAQATATLKALGFGASSSKLVDAIQAGLPAFSKASAAVTALGTAHAGAQKATDNLSGAFAKLKADGQDLLVKLGQLLLPVLQLAATTGVPALTTAVGYLKDHFNVIGPILGTLTAAFVAWKVSLGVGALIDTVAASVVKLTAGMGGLAVSEEAATTAALGLQAGMLAALPPLLAVLAAVKTLSDARSGQQSLGNPFGIKAPFLGGDRGNQLQTPWGTVPDTPITGQRNPVKALGGPVMPNMSYLVGELGPELFRPNVSGTIIPNNRLGGGGITQNLTINLAPGVDRSMVPLIRSVIHQENATLIRSIQSGKR